MLKKDKENLVVNFRKDLKNTEAVLLIEHKNLSFYSFDAARRKAIDGTKITMVKNNLVKIAIKGTKHELLQDHLTNEKFLILSDNLLAACKSAKFFLDNNKNNVKIIVGTSSDAFHSERDILELANLNSIKDLQSKLLRVIKVVVENLLRVIDQKCQVK